MNLVEAQALCLAGVAFKITWLTEVTESLKGQTLVFFFFLFSTPGGNNVSDGSGKQEPSFLLGRVHHLSMDGHG